MSACSALCIPAPAKPISFESTFAKYIGSQETRQLVRSLDAIRASMTVSALVAWKDVSPGEEIEKTSLYVKQLTELLATLRIIKHIRTPHAPVFQWSSYIDPERVVSTRVWHGELVMALARLATLHCAEAGYHLKNTKTGTQLADASFREAIVFFHTAGLVASEWKGPRAQEYTAAMAFACAQLCSSFVDQTKVLGFERAGGVMSAEVYMALGDSYMLAWQQLDAACFESKKTINVVLEEYAYVTAKAMKRVISRKFDRLDLDVYDPPLGIKMGQLFAKYLRSLDPADPGGHAGPMEEGANRKLKKHELSMIGLKPITDEEAYAAFPRANARSTKPAYESCYAQAVAMVESHGEMSSKIVFTV